MDNNSILSFSELNYLLCHLLAVTFCVCCSVSDSRLPIVLQVGEEERLPVIMCTRPAPDLVPECQLFPGEVGGPEEEAADEGRERESDRDSAVESTQGSDTSDGPVRPEDKEDALGHLFFPGEK